MVVVLLEWVEWIINHVTELNRNSFSEYLPPPAYAGGYFFNSWIPGSFEKRHQINTSS